MAVRKVILVDGRKGELLECDGITRKYKIQIRKNEVVEVQRQDFDYIR